MERDTQRRLGGWLGNLLLIASVGGCGLFWTSQGGDDQSVSLVDEDGRLEVDDSEDDEPSRVTLPDAGPFTITADEVEGGAVIVEPDASLYGRDEVVTITAVPTPGSRFTGWTGDLAGKPNAVVVNMSADILATPTFTSDAVVTVQPIGSGRIVADRPLDDLSIGDTVTFTALPDDGRELQSWITDPAAVPGWWSTEWDYRAPITVTSTAVQRDALISVAVDFQAMLDTIGDDAPFDPDSIRVVEVEPDGAIVSPIVPFEFQPSGIEGVGTLRVQLDGDTAAGQARSFHVYFDTIFGGHVPVAAAERVSVTRDELWNGLAVTRIEAGGTTYYFDPAGGGLAGMVDADGNDWISWNSSEGADGRLRGIPNAVHPQGLMHPGEGGSTTSITWTGPLTSEFVVQSANGRWRASWRFSEHAASMTMESVDGPYWFLYDGTPGGALELDTDIVIRSTGESTAARTSWSGDLVGAEWLAVADPNVGRSILLTNHQDDAAVDSYDPLDTMTVLAFGRVVTDPSLTAVPATYSVEFVESIDGADLAAASGQTLGAFTAVTGPPETFESGVVVDETLTVTLTGDMSVQAVFRTG